MLEASAIVVRIEGQLTLVKPDQSGCGSARARDVVQANCLNYFVKRHVTFTLKIQ